MRGKVRKNKYGIGPGFRIFCRPIRFCEAHRPKHIDLNSRGCYWIIPVSLGIIQPSKKVRTASDLRERPAQSHQTSNVLLYNLWYTQHVGLDTT